MTKAADPGPDMPHMNKNGVVEGDNPPVLPEAAIEAMAKPEGRKTKAKVKIDQAVHDGKEGFHPKGHEIEAPKSVIDDLRAKGFVE